MSDTNDFRVLLEEHLRHSESVRAGMAAKNRSGVPTGPVPLGYRKVRREDGTVAVVVDEATAPLVREAFRLAGLKRQSLRKIIKQLGEKGLVSRHGRPLTATALARILTNPFYVGTISFLGETAKGMQDPLVNQMTFEKARKNLVTRRRH